MPRKKAFPLFGQKGQNAEGSLAAAYLGIRNKMCITVAFAECYLNGLSTAEIYVSVCIVLSTALSAAFF